MDEKIDILLNENDIEPNKEPIEEKKKIDENQILKKKISEDNIKGKKKLIEVFKRLEEDLNQEIKKEINENEDLDIENEKDINDEDEQKGDIIMIAIKENWDNQYIKIFFHFMFMFVLPLFVTINLIGIFQIISVMNIFYESIKKAIICYMEWEDKDDKSSYDFYNFYDYYFKESINEGIEFDLIETMGFLGTIIYQFSGFTVSSFLFLVINGISLFLIVNFFNQYRDGKDKYTGSQIIYLCICYILLFIGVGSSALLSQQILVNSYEKYNSFLKKMKDDSCSCWGLFNICRNFLKEKKDNEQKNNNKEMRESKRFKEIKKKEEKEDEKGNIPYFLLVCLTSIFGFFFKYILNLIIYNKKNEFDLKYNSTEINEFNNTFNNMTIDDINNDKFFHDKHLFYMIISIYGVSIVLSIIIHYLFQFIYEENEKQEEKLILGIDDGKCQLCGYIIYTEKLNLEINQEYNNNNQLLNKDSDSQEKLETVTKVISRNKSIQKPKKTLIQRFFDCIKSLFQRCFLCLRLLSDSFISCFNEIICKFFCCGKPKERCCCCFCCECLNKCSKIKDEDYEQRDDFFCYCYKEKRNLKWFNRFIRDETQIKLIPLLIEYFIIQLTTIAFEKIYNSEDNEEENNNSKDSKDLGIFSGFYILSLLLFFYLTISFGQIFSVLSGKEKLKEAIQIISNKILNGTYGILIFNGFYSFIFSLICLTKDINNYYINYYILIPILMNKFYYFTFAYHCAVYTDVEGGIDLISSSTLLSIYLSIWGLFFDFLMDKFSINILLSIQIIFSLIIVLLTSSIISIFLCCIGYFWFTFLYLLSFIPLGGCWFFGCYEKYISKCEENECCKEHEKVCDENYKCLYSCIGKERLKKIYNKIFENKN